MVARSSTQINIESVCSCSFKAMPSTLQKRKATSPLKQAYHTPVYLELLRRLATPVRVTRLFSPPSIAISPSPSPSPSVIPLLLDFATGMSLATDVRGRFLLGERSPVLDGSGNLIELGSSSRSPFPAVPPPIVVRDCALGAPSFIVGGSAKTSLALAPGLPGLNEDAVSSVPVLESQRS